MREDRITDESFKKHISKLVVGGHTQFADCFGAYLDLHLSFFCNNPDSRQEELYRYMRQNAGFRDSFMSAMTECGSLAMGYRDPVGDIFMNHVSRGEQGQFFTPEPISELMAQITDPRKRDSIHDPACGSGRTLLMALKTARANGGEPKLYGNDISITCAKMCLLNFLMNSADGEVTCGDGLTLDYGRFVFFKIDRVINAGSMKILSTYWQYTLADADAVNTQRQKWWLDIAKNGWMSYRAPSAEPASDRELPVEVEVQREENGQLVLF